MSTTHEQKKQPTLEWFPGHMATAYKEAVLTMRKTDVVIEVLDARVPYSSCNPMVEKLRRENNRPALKILNKSDIADPERTREWLHYYNDQPGVTAIALCSKQISEIAWIPNACLALVPPREKPLRMMILGIPNVGKSTLMNAILKRHVAKVGNEPAITKMQMRHELKNGMWLIDTPGMMWPRVPLYVGMKLAAAHSIGPNAYDLETVAAYLGAYLITDYPQVLIQRFGSIDGCTDGHELLTMIARVRSCVGKGGLPDHLKAAQLLLNDFRAGTLGRITLETPPQVAEWKRLRQSNITQ